MSGLSTSQRRSLALGSASHRYRRSAQVKAIALIAERNSTRPLDFLSLAFCSCALTLLCHSALTPPQPTARAESAPAATATLVKRVSAAFQPFTLTSTRPKVEDTDRKKQRRR